MLLMRATVLLGSSAYHWCAVRWWMRPSRLFTDFRDGRMPIYGRPSLPLAWNCRSPPRSQTSLVAHHSCSVRAAIITPVESSAAYLARFTDDSDLPRYSGGSAPTLALSRPSQCSLTLRPARSADPLRGLSIEVLQIIRRLLIRSDRFRLEREFAGPDFHRGERCALPRHTEQSGGKFPSTDPTAGAQDAALQERGLCAKFLSTHAAA